MNRWIETKCIQKGEKREQERADWVNRFKAVEAQMRKEKEPHITRAYALPAEQAVMRKIISTRWQSERRTEERRARGGVMRNTVRTRWQSERRKAKPRARAQEEKKKIGSGMTSTPTIKEERPDSFQEPKKGEKREQERADWVKRFRMVEARMRKEKEPHVKRAWGLTAEQAKMRSIISHRWLTERRWEERRARGAAMRNITRTRWQSKRRKDEPRAQAQNKKKIGSGTPTITERPDSIQEPESASSPQTRLASMKN
ncbi:hypothetical protein MMC07_009701 [Pseudocyphellaria aurata]|nr:hypothetical protein [Pseudocyphellaria aurata]